MMSNRFSWFLLLSCAALTAGCRSDGSVEPEPYQPPVVPVLTTLELKPATVVIEQGNSFDPTIVSLDQFGNYVRTNGALTFSSNDPLIASVSNNGRITAHEPGLAAITATMSIGGVTKSAGVQVSVKGGVFLDEVVLKAGSTGWTPYVTYLVAGGTARWVADPPNWAGMPHGKLYVMDSVWTVIDSLDLSSGQASRRLHTKGRIWYCSGICWDEPDVGIIVVR